MLGSPRTFVVPLTSSDGADGGVPFTELCDATLPSDGAGRVVVRIQRTDNPLNGGDAWLHVFRPEGGDSEAVRFGPFSAVDALPLVGGWLIGNQLGSGGSGTVFGVELSLFEPDADSQPVVFTAGLPSRFARAPSGGGAAAGPQAGATPCPTPPVDQRRLQVTRFDPSGAPSGPTEIGCVFDEHTDYGLAENADGDVIALLPDGGWHIAPDGTVTTFPPTGVGLLRPLADGRFARKEDLSTWNATVAPEGTVTPPPCWLADRSDVTQFQIVLGGEAYLAFHDSSGRFNTDETMSCDRYAELILADGTSCGFIPLSGTDGGCNHSVVAVGLDGTLTTLDRGSCTVSAWPGVFR